MKAQIEIKSNENLEKSTNIEAKLYIDEKYYFSMNLDNFKKVPNYLNAVINYGLPFELSDLCFKQVDNSEKEQKWEMNSNLCNKDKFIENCKYLHSKKYILARNEFVQEDNYCAFYGSSNMVWNSIFFTYPRGNHQERFIQTLYDMVNINPKIYRWTNAGAEFFIEMEKDNKLKEFYEFKIKPVMVKLKDNATQTDITNLVNILNQVETIKNFNLEELISH